MIQDKFGLNWPSGFRGELQFLGNNSKTVNKNRNLTWVKMISTARSTYPAILK
jgi:hypothetical protein